MPGVATSPPSTTGRRRRALERYLDRLRQECATKVRTADRPTHIDTGEGVVAVGAWAMEGIRGFFDGRSAGPPDGGELLAHSVALQLKSTVDAHRLQLLTEPSGKADVTLVQFNCVDDWFIFIPIGSSCRQIKSQVVTQLDTYRQFSCKDEPVEPTGRRR